METVRNRAIDSVRREGALKRPRTANVEATELSDDGNASPLDQMIDQSEAFVLHASLSRLPAAQSEVIALAFFGGMSHSEIAAELSLPAGTVKGRIRLGIEKLRLDVVGG